MCDQEHQQADLDPKQNICEDVTLDVTDDVSLLFDSSVLEEFNNDFGDEENQENENLNVLPNTSLKAKRKINRRNRKSKASICKADNGAPLIVPTVEVPVFFDLETSGFSEKTDEILQIAAKYDDKTFEIYITPTMPIPADASAVNKLTNVDGNLYFQGVLVPSVPLLEAIKQFKVFLQSSNKLCVLVAHKCTFDKKFLLRALAKTRKTKEFRGILHGFVDTLPIFQARLNRKFHCSLGHLAKEANLCTLDAHNAVADIMLLEEVLKHRGISHSLLLSQKQLWKPPKDRKKKSVIENLWSD